MTVKSRKGNQVQTKICALLYGSEGSGKSTFALNSMYLHNTDGRPFRVMYIDCENGSVDDYMERLENDGVDLGNLYLCYTTSLTDTMELIKKATNKEPFYDEDGEMIEDADGNQFIPDMIVVDGSTVLHKTTQQATREFSQKRAGIRADKAQVSAKEKSVMVEGAGIELKDYGAINFKGQDLVLSLTASGLNYIITAREKEVMEQIEIIKNGQKEVVSKSTGTYEPDGFKDIGYNVKTVMRLYRESDDDPTVKLWVKKDRTGTFLPYSVTEDPSILAFQQVIDKGKGKKDFVIANNLHEDVKREVEQTEKEMLKKTEDIPVTPDTVVTKTEKKKEDADELINVKDELRAFLNGAGENKKREIAKAVKEAGLPTSPAKLTGVEEYKKYLEIAKSV